MQYGVSEEIYYESLKKQNESLEEAWQSDKHTFHLPENIQMPFKYNNLIPLELLRKQFVEDFIDLAGMKKDIKEWDEWEYR